MTRNEAPASVLLQSRYHPAYCVLLCAINAMDAVYRW
jgi:hypothetical protein